MSEKAKASIEALEPEGSGEGKEDIFALPPQAASADTSSSSEEECCDSESTLESDSPTKNWDIHSIDMESAHFRSLPADVRHEILTEVKETRKQSSWGRLHELPTKSDDFAVFQLNRLRKRYHVQVSLEEAEREMGGHSLSLAQLEKLLNDQGVITNNPEIGSRIASDESTRYLLIKDVKKAVEEAKQESLGKETGNEGVSESKCKTKADVEFENDLKQAIQLSKQETADSSPNSEDDDDLKKAIQLSLECEPSSSKEASSENEKNSFNFTFDADDNDFMSSSSSDSENDNVLTSAKNYMMEYSGLTPAEIAKIIGKQKNSERPDKTNEKSGNTSNERKKKESENLTLTETNAVSSVKKAPAQDVEIMSDSDSDSSENFVEVKDDVSVNKEPGLEIVFKPTETLDDDLFGDIFENKEKEVIDSVETNKDVPELQLPTEISADVEKEDQLKQSITIQSPKDRNEVIAEKQSTINTIREMLKSVKDVEPDAKSVKMSVEELKEVQANLSQESKELRAEKSAKERLASNITDQMYQEAQVK